MFLCCHSYANYLSVLYFVFFFFNDTPTTEIYTDTLFPYTTLFRSRLSSWHGSNPSAVSPKSSSTAPAPSCRCRRPRQSDRKSTRLNPVTNAHLVCRLLLEKKNKNNKQETESTTQEQPVNSSRETINYNENTTIDHNKRDQQED